MALPTDSNQDFANYAEAYKIWYATGVVETLKRKARLFEKLKTKSKKSGGSKFLEPIALRNPNAVGARADGKPLPSGRGAQYVNSEILAKYNYVRIAASNVAEAHSASKKGAWARVKTEQLKRSASDFAEDIERQLWGAGHGGICEAKSVSGSGPYVVTVIGYEDNAASGLEGLLEDVRYALERNMFLVWGTVAQLATTGDGYGYVTDVADDGSTFTVAVSAGNPPAADDVFVKGDENVAGKHAYGTVEMMGVQGIFDDADDDLQNIDTGDYPEWAAKRFSNPNGAGSSRAIDEIEMQAVVDYVDAETTGECEFIGLHHNTRRAYAEALKARNGERFQPTMVKGGYNRRHLTFHASGKDLPLVECRHAPQRRMFFFGPESMKLYIVKGFHWDESNGGMWKWDGSTDALTGFGKMYANAGTSNRRACASYDDLSVEIL